MNLKECPVPVFGDIAYRGKCPKEEVEQASFFSRLRREYPASWGLIALHPRNEGLKVGRQFSSVMKHQAEGMTKGAADIIIPASPSFVCELKRQDHTLSQWQDGQQEYLEAAAKAGAFACVALGAVAAWGAFEVWLNEACHNAK
jgi:hypothetical protein